MSGLACPDFSAFVFHGKRLDSDRRASGGEYRRIFSEAGAFNELQAPKVMEMAAKGYSYRRIARELGLGKDTVMDIVKRAREGVT